MDEKWKEYERAKKTVALIKEGSGPSSFENSCFILQIVVETDDSACVPFIVKHLDSFEDTPWLMRVFEHFDCIEGAIKVQAQRQLDVASKVAAARMCRKHRCLEIPATSRAVSDLPYFIETESAEGCRLLHSQIILANWERGLIVDWEEAFDFLSENDEDLASGMLSLIRHDRLELASRMYLRFTGSIDPQTLVDILLGDEKALLLEVLLKFYRRATISRLTDSQRAFHEELLAALERYQRAQLFPYDLRLLLQRLRLFVDKSLGLKIEAD